MSEARPRNETQLSPGLPGLTHHITGHDASGQSIVESDRPGTWTPWINGTMAFDVVYTTSTFPPNMNGDADLATHDKIIQSKKLGLVNPNGTVARMVDFGPGTRALMHRTQSLDYGIILEGEVEMILDDGVTRIMKRGDVAVQRGTNHGWRNTSSTEWARMFFVLQDAQKIEIGGKEIGEELSGAGKDAEALAGRKEAGSKT